MKKVLALILALVLLIGSAALAESNFADLITMDLSNLTLEQLILLREKIELTMWGTDDWQMVVVPQGVYQIGVDIPAGKWTISAPEGDFSCIYIGNAVNPDGEVDLNGECSMFQRVDDEAYSGFDENKDLPSVDIELTDGYYIQIKYSSVIFTPYIGKNLGFKFK